MASRYSWQLGVGQFIALGLGLPNHHWAAAWAWAFTKCLAFICLEREKSLVIASPQMGHGVLVVCPEGLSFASLSVKAGAIALEYK